MTRRFLQAAIFALAGLSAFYFAYVDNKKGRINYRYGIVRADKEPQRFKFSLALTILFGILLEVSAILTLIGVF